MLALPWLVTMTLSSWKCFPLPLSHVLGMWHEEPFLRQPRKRIYLMIFQYSVIFDALMVSLPFFNQYESLKTLPTRTESRIQPWTCQSSLRKHGKIALWPSVAFVSSVKSHPEQCCCISLLRTRTRRFGGTAQRSSTMLLSRRNHHPGSMPRAYWVYLYCIQCMYIYLYIQYITVYIKL